jgi:transporter family protein
MMEMKKTTARVRRTSGPAQKESESMWLVNAFLSALIATLTSVLAKVGIVGVNSHLATATRTAVVLVLAWFIVYLTGAQSGLGEISKRSG